MRQEVNNLDSSYVVQELELAMNQPLSDLVGNPVHMCSHGAMRGRKSNFSAKPRPCFAYQLPDSVKIYRYKQNLIKIYHVA